MNDGAKLPLKFGQEEQRVPSEFGSGMLIRGLTPYIGSNGNWWTGEIDSGIAATGPIGPAGADGKDGADGLTPRIGANGNWWIGETDTGVSAEGKAAEGSVNFTTDESLKLDPKTGVLSVNTAKQVEEDNTLPITSAAVHTVVGNIEALLKTI